MESGDSGEARHSHSVVVQLSQQAFLNKGGKVKVLLRPSKSQKPTYKTFVDGTREAHCTPGYCVCRLRCMLYDGAGISGNSGQQGAVTQETVVTVVVHYRWLDVIVHSTTSGSTSELTSIC